MANFFTLHHCGENGALETVGSDFVLREGVPTMAGLRRCSSLAGLGLMFTVIDGYASQAKLLAIYPQTRIDFDSSIPPAVLAALREAITCHAEGRYIAAAIMIRKTLEELCHERGAVNCNLKERIKALGKELLIPAELIQAMDDLRSLGNDAAHIESQTFQQVSAEEVEIGVEFAKEILKATYQYQHLLGQLRRLKTL